MWLVYLVIKIFITTVVWGLQSSELPEHTTVSLVSQDEVRWLSDANLLSRKEAFRSKPPSLKCLDLSSSCYIYLLLIAVELLTILKTLDVSIVSWICQHSKVLMNNPRALNSGKENRQDSSMVKMKTHLGAYNRHQSKLFLNNSWQQHLMSRQRVDRFGCGLSYSYHPTSNCIWW